MKKISNGYNNITLKIFMLLLFSNQAFAAPNVQSIDSINKLVTEITGYVSFIFKVILTLVVVGIAYMFVKEPERLKEHAYKAGLVVMGCLMGVYSDKISEFIFKSM